MLTEMNFLNVNSRSSNPQHPAYAFYIMVDIYVVMLGRRGEAGFKSNMPSSRHAFKFISAHCDTHGSNLINIYANVYQM